MADLGVIEEDVVFDWGKATVLSDELRSTANVLEFQVGERERIRGVARTVWQGRYGDEFDGRVSTCIGDAERFVTSLRAAADGVDELARLAREEQNRREAAREWVASQNDDGGLFGGVPVVGAIEDTVRDGVDAVHDHFTGDEVPPELEATDPPTIPIGEPSPATRETSPAAPAPGGGGGDGSGGGGSGGVSSANPDDLDAWVTSSTGMDETIATRKGTLDDAHSDFVASCEWGSCDASSLLTAVGTWVTYNGTDASWVSTVGQAFRDADTGSGGGAVVTIPDAVIGARLDAAGLSGGRASVTYDEPIVWGEPPTSGYAADPVNTASGNFVETEVDVAAGGLRRVLRFTRTYNSRSDRVGPFGRGWASWASCRLRAEPDGAHWVGPDGQEAVIPLVPSSSGGRGNGDGDGPGARTRPAFARVLAVPGLVTWAGDGLVLTGFGGGRFVFDRDGRLVSADDGPGTDVAFTYDDRERLVEMRHGGSAWLQVDWDGDGERARVVGLRGSDGRAVTYHYDDEGRLVEVDGGPRGRRRYEVDDRGRVVAVVDADGVVEVRNTYDDGGRVVAQTSPLGRRSRFRYLVGRVTMVDDDAAGPVNSYVHDDQGRLVGAVDGHGNELRKTYDRWGNPTRVVERDGSVTLQEWDDKARLVRRQAPNGSWARFAYDDLDRLTDVTVSAPPGAAGRRSGADEVPGSPTSRRPEAGRSEGDGGDAGTEATTRYRYEGDERTPVEIVDPEGGVTRLDVEGGLVRRVVDPDSVEVRFGYDANGDLTSVTDAAGNTARVERDASGRVTATVSPSGLRTEMAYGDAGRLAERRGPGGAAVWRYEWTAAGRLRAVTDPTGARREQRYGSNGQAEQIVDELGYVTSRRFDALGNLVGVVLPDGAKWEYSYDRLCRLVGVTDPAGSTWLQEYDVAGRLLGTIDPVGGHRRAIYDAAGRVTGVDDGLTSVAFELDGLGRAVTHRRPDGTEADATYDRCGRIVAVTDPAGGVTRYEYTPAGRLAAATSPLGHVTRYEHDRCGRRAAVVDPLGNRWSYRYDADFRVTQVVAPTGEITRFRYDDAGRLAARVSSAGGATRYEYDPAGRVVAVASPTGGVTRYAWDPRGQLVAATDPDGGVVRYERDERGLLRTLVDPLGGRVEHRYDPIGRLVERRDQLGRSTHWVYDSAGRLVRRVLPTGEQHRWWYDGSGRVRAVGVSDDRGPIVEIERDPLGRPAVVTEPGFLHELRWDPLGRLAAKTRNGLGLTWRYDADGRRVAIGYPDGTETTFDHDPAGRPTAAHHPALGTVQFEHDAAGRLVTRTTRHATHRWHHTNGLLTTHERLLHDPGDHPPPPDAPDDEGRWEVTVLDRDAAGRVVAATTDGTRTGYRYDPAGQLARVEGAGGPWSFGYDVAGRLVTEAGPDGDTLYRYDAAHQLVDRRSGDAATRYRYDDAGRRIAETFADGTTRSYDWDWFGRLSGVEQTPSGEPTVPGNADAGGNPGSSSTATRLTVDALGDLAEIDGMPLLWDPVETIPQLRWLDGTAVVGDHQPWATVSRDGAPAWLDHDWQGSIPGLGLSGLAGPAGHRHQADIDGAAGSGEPGAGGRRRAGSGGAGQVGLAGQGSVGPTDLAGRAGGAAGNVPDPWGGPAGGFGTEALGLGYRGELGIDGLVWLRRRAYDPATRGFLSPDPLPGLPGQAFAAHPYHYAGNDPVGSVDPLGLRPMTEADLNAYREATANSGLLDRAGAVVSDAWNATTDWVGENWEYIAMGGVLVAATLIGGPVGTAMVAGMLLSGGISAGAQYALTGEVHWDQVALDAAIGGAAGGAGAWAGGATATWSATARVGTRIAASTATDVGGGMLSRWGQGQNPFDVQGMAIDTLSGTAGGAAGEGLDALRASRASAGTAADDLLAPTAPPVDPTPPPTANPQPLAPGQQPYQLSLFPEEPYNRVRHYGRTPTPEQQASVPPGMEFDHDPPLVQHYYEGPGDGSLPGYNLTPEERRAYAASLEHGGPATPAAQRAQGGATAQYSRKMKEMWGL